VLNATPLLRIDIGKISLGKTQPIGPKETPYANVNVYMPLGTQMLKLFQGNEMDVTNPMALHAATVWVGQSD